MRISLKLPAIVVPTLALLVVAFSGAFAFSASAATSSAGWSISSVAEPTNFQSSDKGHDRYALTAVNVGSRATNDEVTIRDTLPAGLVATRTKLVESGRAENEGTCEVANPLVKCTFEDPVPAGRELLLTIEVEVESPLIKGELSNEVTVSDGEGGEASVSEPTMVNAGPAAFGINQFAFESTGLDGRADTESADHPFAVTSRIDLNTDLRNHPSTGFGGDDGQVVQAARNVVVELPLGFAGDPLATERCPAIDMTNTLGDLGGDDLRTICPDGSIVGAVRLVWEGGSPEEAQGYRESEGLPVYNLVPAHGYPAELGFNAGAGQPVFLYATVVPSPSGYRLRISSPGTLNVNDVEDIVFTTYGDPAEHDGTGGNTAFVTNPTRCSLEPLTAKVEVSGWEGGFETKEATAYPDITGCNLLQQSAPFSPNIAVTPETTQADTPSGYEVDLKFPQAPNAFGVLATPELKDAMVTFPAGMSISPAQAGGPDALEGCTASQIDLEGTELGEGHPGGNASPYDDTLEHATPGRCPEGSRVGTVKIKTPLLEESLEGHLFLAQPSCGGQGQVACTEEAAEKGEVFGLYLEAQAPKAGVIVKLAGSIEVGGNGPHSVSTGLAPGQVRTRFDDNPQMPVENVQIVLPGGQRAALANPQTCGTATTSTDLEPWSAPESGPDATPISAFTVTGCEDRFAPAFSAGTVTPSAGGFSPFTLTLGRHDGEQDLSGVTVTMPPGLLGALKGVVQCPEPQASKGECGEGSLVGHDQVAAGAGTEPLWETGRVFLTGPYKGAPFGLSIVTPAVAGPFNLGNVVVRAAISVNPVTSQITTVSDPLPQFVDGVPLRVKTVNVTIDRAGFIFNPTNCDQQAVAGTISSAQGTSVGVSSPFAAAGCANLPFKPSFQVSTQGKTSKADGASLVVRVSQRPGEANIHKVDLTLPLVLPARLTTLQKACTAAQFEANPAGCPAASDIGSAIAHTPVLSSPLSGPAYLVSHGGAAFPDVEFVLQGEGVTIVLDGGTDIKKGITYSRFETVPDAPISSFETVLPEGPHSVLAANGDLCAPTKTVTVKKRVAVRRKDRRVIVVRSVKQQVVEPLVIPTVITAQNGAVLKQTTKVAVTGCPKVKKAAKKKAKGRNGKKGKR
jgi:Domain of unknown function DUF11